jgi:DNA-binding HxlR family transcriptional regulator
MKTTTAQHRLPAAARKKGHTEPAQVAPCLIEETLKVVSKRWTLLIIRDLLMMHWGTEEQKKRYVPKILSAEEIWRQRHYETL